MLALEGLVDRDQTIHFSIIGQEIGLVYCDIEWFALETNRDHSVVSEITSKNCISDSSAILDGA